VKCLLALFLLMPSISFAQSRFDGTWEIKMETLMFSYNPLEYLRGRSASLDSALIHPDCSREGELPSPNDGGLGGRAEIRNENCN
jgi:hypothetical protein